MDQEQFNEDEIQVISLEDENGEEHEFEIIDIITDNDTEYYALLPYYETPEELDSKPDEDEQEVLLMKLVKQDGNEILESIENEEEYNRVADLFDERLSADLEEDIDDEE